MGDEWACCHGLGLVTGVAGEGFVEGVEQNDGDDPEDDLGGDAFLLGYLFVKVLAFHRWVAPLLWVGCAGYGCRRRRTQAIVENGVIRMCP
jgi:hypothetical protein